MINYLILLLDIILVQINNGIFNRIGKNDIHNLSDRFLFITLTSAVAFLFQIAVFSVSDRTISAFTLILGAIFGILIFLLNLFTIFALSMGNMSITYLIITSSSLIPAFSGILFFGESFGLFQLIGVVLMIISLVLCVSSSKTEKKKKSGFNLRWIIYAFSSAFFSGMTGIVQKIHQTSEHKNELTSFLASAMLTSTLISLILCLILRDSETKKNKEISLFPQIKNLLPISFSGGLCLSGIHLICLYLVGALPSILFFPVHSGSAILLTAVQAKFLFHEKLHRIQVVGFFLGIISILLLSNILAFLE